MAQTPKLPTRAEFDKALSDLKESNAVLRRVTADRDNSLRKVQEKYKPEVDRLTAEGDRARDVIQRYSVGHRESGLLPAGAKSVYLDGVSIGWKIGPPALVCKEGTTWDDALKLVQKKLPDCIRANPELNKQMLKVYAQSPKTAKTVAACGLELKAEEKFFAEPETV